MADVLDFNEAQMYFGYPYIVNEHIAIKLPTVGDIIEYDDVKYYSMIYTMCSIPSDMKSVLFDIGIDYEEISDFDFFRLIGAGFSDEELGIILYDPVTEEPLDLSSFGSYLNNDTGKVCLYNIETEQTIDELAYIKMIGYLRKAHNIKPKVEKAANKTTKKILIDLDREDRAKQKDNKNKSILMPMVSAMMRYPGFKYKSRELKECGIYEFMDTYIGSSIYIQSTALLQGSYSGMIDTSKINKKQFDWSRRTIE